MSDPIIAFGPTPRRARALLGDTVLADSANAVVLLERAHDPVIYFPEADVAKATLESTDSTTHCPYKGDASYWTVIGDGQRFVDAVWCYRNPIPMAATIKDHCAFWASRLGPDFRLEVSE